MNLTLKQQVMDILAEHGIKMNVTGCGCCGSPTVSFEHDGKLVVDEEDQFGFEMMPSNIESNECETWHKIDEE